MKNNNDYLWKAAATLWSGSNRDEGYRSIISLAYAKRLMLQSGVEQAEDPRKLPAVIKATCKRSHSNPPADQFIAASIKQLFSADTDGSLTAKIFELLPDDADALAKVILDTEFEEAFSRPADGSFQTPASVVSLALRILDPQKDQTFADFGSGTGSVLIAAAQRTEASHIHGCDINPYTASLAALRAEILGDRVEACQCDMFDQTDTLDRAFSNYPLGTNARDFNDDVIRNLEQQGIHLPRFQSSDWLFNAKLVSALAEGGKAVGIMARGGSFNSADREIRRYFIEKGFVESVILLPEKLFSPAITIPTMMIVLSRGNDRIQIVDASNECEKGRRKNLLSDENIARICMLLSTEEAGASCTVPIDKLATNDYILNPERYLAKQPEIANSTSIAAVALNITRGTNLTKRALEELNSNVPTDCRYLMLGDIVDGEITKRLPYLTSIGKNQEKYCVHTDDLVISKTGPNFKIAVAHVPEGQTILATGNLFIVRLDREKVHPIYLKLFLESDQGMAQLQANSVGTTIQSLTVKAFDNIVFPMVSLDEQQAIVEQYRKLKAEIDMHQHAIERAQSRISSLLKH